ncbi:MAG: hypothetical protein BWY96_01513 [Spirochaetes bacterium ADurb.BinA120]|nr:MAG: hypothetical protein BWY96_01513 [Spirochaetes bacterium ADurb.BinA120]
MLSMRSMSPFKRESTSFLQSLRPESRYSAPITASSVLARIEGLARPPLRSSPLPIRRKLPRLSSRATLKSVASETTADLIFARSPSGYFSKRLKRYSFTTSARTESPRYSRRSLSLAPGPASFRYERWVSARFNRLLFRNLIFRMLWSLLICRRRFFFLLLACLSSSIMRNRPGPPRSSGLFKF